MIPVAAKKQLSPSHQIVGGQDRLQVVAGVDGGLALVGVAGPQASLDLAAHRLEGGGSDDPLRRPPHADQQVHPGIGPGGGDGAGHVPVGDQPDPGPGARAPRR